MGVMDKINARIQSEVAKDSGAPTPDIDLNGAVEEPDGKEATATEPKKAAEMPAPDAEGAPPEQIDRKTTLETKLREVREERRAREQARVDAAEARRLRQQAESDARAAAEERARYEGLREGSFKEVLTTLGRDPRKIYEEMTREAVDAGTPEGQIRRLEHAMNERLASLEKSYEERMRQLDEERAHLRSRAEGAAFQADFAREIASPGYEVLREAYEDADVMERAQQLSRNRPLALHLAKQHGVNLTNPQRGFLMKELLDILKAVQNDYDSQRKARAERLRGAKPAPKVNGIPGSSHAAGTIDNDLASARAVNGASKLTRAERIEREIARQEGR